MTELFSAGHYVPDLMPCDFFLWGFIKDHVYIPPLPNDLPQLRHITEDHIASITSDWLTEVWEELYIRLDVCRITFVRNLRLVYLKFDAKLFVNSLN